jgi:outer membrane protein OmpA-like peptidoglycan-associated protein
MIIRKGLSTLLAATATGLTLAACATSSSVDKKIAAAQAQTDSKIESVSGQVEQLQEKQRQTDVKLEELGKSANDALQRATDAGVLAKGKVVFQQTFSDADNVKFKTGSDELSDDATKALDELAEKVKGNDHAIYIEIQGYTDNRGGTEYNERLGERRAESVRRYLNKQHGLPLVRMSTVSYGENDPVADNKTKAGRAQNRRVVVVVLE